MQERRINSTDRRQRKQWPKTPFRDSHGDLIALNRRYIPERRRTHLAQALRSLA